MDTLLIPGSSVRFRLLALGSLACLALSAEAQNVWIGSDGGAWTSSVNWSLGHRPEEPDNVELTQTGATPQTVVFRNNISYVPYFYSFLIEGTGAGSMILKQSGPTSDQNSIFTLGEIVGRTGTGIHDQSGGFTALGDALVLGDQATGHGIYRLSGGNAFLGVHYAETEKTMIVGNAGSGEFHQSGAVAMIGNLIVGKQATGTGIVTLDNDAGVPYADQSIPSPDDTYKAVIFDQPIPKTGILYTDKVTVGAEGTGSVFQSDGILVANSVGIGTEGTGHYDLSGGILSTVMTLVGTGGNASFSHTGGGHDTTLLFVGGASGFSGANSTNSTTGDYKLGGDGILDVSFETVIGSTGTGTFSQDGGTFKSRYLTIGDAGNGGVIQSGGDTAVANGILLGHAAGGSGSYNLSGGSLSAATIAVGHNGDATFIHQAGTNHVGDFVTVGSTAGHATYELSGGELSAFGLFVGQAGADWGLNPKSGSGEFRQTGGTVTLRDLEVGQAGTTAVAGPAAYRLGGGTLNFDYAYIGGVLNNDLGLPGVFEQTGGVVHGNGSFNRLYLAGAESRYDLSGGSVQVGSLAAFVGSSINQTAGTIATESVGILGANYRFSGADSTLVVSAGEHGEGAIMVGARTTYGTTDVRTASFTQNGGSITVTSGPAYAIALQIAGGGRYDLGGAALLTVNGREHVGGYSGIEPELLAAPLEAYFNQTGGTHRVNGTLTVAGAEPLLPYGEAAPGVYSLSGGSLAAQAIDNRGQFHFSGGTLAASQFTNSGTFTLTGGGVRTVDAPVTNTGTVEVKNTQVVYTGSFTNHGAYVSDPSTNTFTTLVVGETGYLRGGAGDHFIMGADLLNGSRENVRWDTTAASLTFAGAGPHRFSLGGVDYGADPHGYLENFAWGTFTLAAGANLQVFDGNDTEGAAFYSGLFLLGGGLDQLALIQSNFNFYYDASLLGNAWLAHGSYDFVGGGRLIGIERPQATPDAANPFVLVAATVVGLAAFARGRRQAFAAL